jgi:hypothetical protein
MNCNTVLTLLTYMGCMRGAAAAPRAGTVLKNSFGDICQPTARALHKSAGLQKSEAVWHAISYHRSAEPVVPYLLKAVTQHVRRTCSRSAHRGAAIVAAKDAHLCIKPAVTNRTSLPMSTPTTGRLSVPLHPSAPTTHAMTVLSAKGSRYDPKTDSCWKCLATKPSSQSLTPACASENLIGLLL